VLFRSAAINELARRGCGLVVLHELWLCGYRSATLAEDARAAAEPLDGPVQQRLAGLAREAGLVLCAGSFPERDGGRLFNTAVVYGPAGDLLLSHRKACLYGDAETGAFSAGEVAVTAGEVPGLGQTGLCVCFDGDFPETARSLRAAGAGVVLHPSAYEVAAESWWDTIYPAQALCNGQWWLSANQHGGAGGDRMLGVSLLLAIGLQANFLTNYTNFILLLLYVLIPWTAINLVDYYLIRHGDYDVAAFFDPSGGPYGQIGWVGLGTYLVGILVEIPFMSTTLYTGPAAKAMDGTDLAWLVGLVVTVPLYYVLTSRLVAKRPATAPQPVAG